MIRGFEGLRGEGASIVEMFFVLAKVYSLNITIGTYKLFKDLFRYFFVGAQ